jgi:2-(1,2-epoxy-1,2-dihydrophenyl)acetyl-CoA isomerase
MAPEMTTRTQTDSAGGAKNPTVAAWLDEETKVAHLRLTRGGSSNAINRQVVEDLAIAVERIRDMVGTARAVLIDAEGARFSVGGDLEHFTQNIERLAGELNDMVEQFHASLTIVAELPIPVVCAVQGAAAGGGLGLLWVSDIVIAADDVKIITAFSRLGVSGDGGSTWFLPRLVGLRRAQHLVLQSPVVDAAGALQHGLVTRVVDRGVLAHEALATATQLAAGPTVSLGLQRRLLRQAAGRSLSEGFSAELEAMRIAGSTKDAGEGMSAFVARRAAAFAGE